MTKEIKIQEAYEKLGINPEEFGFDGLCIKLAHWVEKEEALILSKVNELVCKKHLAHGLGMFHPKSLQGIEDNNGWIKIESEADLPKYPWTKYDTCWARRIDGFISVIIIKDLTHDNHSHWKETGQQKQPIY